MSASSGRWRRHPMKHETLAHLQQFRLFFFLLPLALLDISDTLVEGICVLSRKPNLYEVELTEVLLRNMPCKQYGNLLQTL